MIGRN
ncbi:hypothetical protein YPPY47_3101, partial [Yersinia pestis PY-47]